MQARLELIKGAILKNKRIILLVALVTVGILILALSSGGDDVSSSVGETTLGEYKASLEAELCELCSKIEGVGRCYVSVSFSRGAQNSYKGSSLIETKPPEVLGITVICKGADSDLVRSRVIDMLSALFGIGSNRIAILKLK